MRRPSLQFYPDDWRNNANLRRCSWAARGVWVEVMCLMHDSDRYGILEWPLKEIAQALGCPMVLLRELVAKGVMKGTDSGACEPLVYRPRSGRRDGAPVVLVAAQPGPIWFSSRMVRDEYVRSHAGASSRFGTSPVVGSDDAASPSRRHGERQSGSPSRRHGERQGAAPGQRRSDGSSTSSPSSEQNGEGIADASGVGARAAGARADATLPPGFGEGPPPDLPPDLPAGPLPDPPPDARVVRKPHRIPDDWRAPGELLALARDRGIDGEEQAEVFRDYWRSEATPQARKLDWNAAFRVWLSRVGTRRPDGGRRREGLEHLRGSVFDEPPPATRTHDGRPIIDGEMAP